MSLINQMLKDLDQRRGPLNETQFAALQGMGLVNINQLKWHRGLPLAAGFVAGIMAILVSYQANTWWNNKPESKPVFIPQAATEVAGPEQNAKLDTVATPDNIHAAAPARIADKVDFKENPLDKPAVRHTESPTTAPPTALETDSAPVTVLTAEQKAERLFTRAQRALSRDQQQRGENLLRKALTEYSGHQRARSQLAALLLSRKQEDRAERVLAEGLATDSRQPALARPYAQLLAARGELVPALETLDRAIDQRQPDPETLALRAAILDRMDRHTESAATYRKALQLQPQRALWWTGLAVALERDSQTGQALEAYQHAARRPLDKPVADYVNQRIQVLRNKEHHQ